MTTHITATIETVEGPGIPLYQLTVAIPGLGTFCYQPLKSADAARAIAACAVEANPYELSMMLCSKGWRNTVSKRGGIRSFFERKTTP